MSLSHPSIDSLSIHRSEIALELITPIFMAGAHNVIRADRGEFKSYKSDLRAASLRGEIRYWYRAWLGGGEVGDKHQELHQRESLVFGNAQIGSFITVRLHDVRLRFTATRLDMQPNPPIPMLVHGQQDRVFAPAILSGTFTVELSNRFGRDELIQTARDALWLLVNLGGIGKRSRRGFGSLRCTTEELYDSGLALRNGLEKALEALPQPHHGAYFSRLPSYAVLHPEYCKIAVCTDEFETYQDAMRAFWDVLRHPPREMIFGYVSGTKRLASPVHLHIVKVQTDEGIRYCPVMTAFRTSARLFNGESWSMVEQLLKDVAGANNIIYGQGTSW